MTNPALAMPALLSAVADRAALSRAAEIVSLAVEKRNTYPILANVRLRGDGKILFLSGTNLDVMIDVAVPAAADADLDVTVPAHLLKDLLKGAPKAADMVALSAAENDGVLLDFDAAQYTLNGLSPAEWPVLKGPEAGTETFRRFTLPAADLYSSLSGVRFAVSTEETRYYLNGVYIHCIVPHGGNRAELRFVATDGHRMARQEITAPDSAVDMAGIILPRDTVDMLLKLLKPVKGAELPDVTIEATDAKIRLMFGDVTVTSKIVEGTFPDYERVTPKNNDKPVTVGIFALQEAIKAVSLITSERGGKSVKFTTDPGTLTLSAYNVDNGTAETTIDAETEDCPEDFEIGFRARYLDDILKNMKIAGDTEATFIFNDAGSPTLITGARDGWLAVLMPMRV